MIVDFEASVESTLAMFKLLEERLAAHSRAIVARLFRGEEDGKGRELTGEEFVWTWLAYCDAKEALLDAKVDPFAPRLGVRR